MDSYRRGEGTVECNCGEETEDGEGRGGIVAQTGEHRSSSGQMVSYKRGRGLWSATGERRR